MRTSLRNSVRGTLGARTVRLSQDSIRSSFKDDRPVKNLIDGLRSGKVSAKDVPPIRVFEKDGLVYTLDNRRLYAFQKAGVEIRTVAATSEEIVEEAWKFTTKNAGKSVRVRGN